MYNDNIGSNIECTSYEKFNINYFLPIFDNLIDNNIKNIIV